MSENDMMKDTVILTCSSMQPFVDEAQKTCGTEYPVYTIDRKFHAEPDVMKEELRRMINDLPESVHTILVGTGFCGGIWDHTSFSRRLVIPRADDCVSILLHTDDNYMPNRKEMGHLYLYENKPEDFSALKLMHDYTGVDRDFQKLDPGYLKEMWFSGYHSMDIIDTDFNNCYDEHYVEEAQKNADMINAELGYVTGSNRLMEKLVSGKWDEQFLVAEPGHLIIHGDFF